MDLARGLKFCVSSGPVRILWILVLDGRCKTADVEASNCAHDDEPSIQKPQIMLQELVFRATDKLHESAEL